MKTAEQIIGGADQHPNEKRSRNENLVPAS